ncbi:MAG: hypothetical protein RAO94_12440 [Candidatus Stygibacter australis]|nr:hypothetical protein [Candidatus Stygibacter australis]
MDKAVEHLVKLWHIKADKTPRPGMVLIQRCNQSIPALGVGELKQDQGWS